MTGAAEVEPLYVLIRNHKPDGKIKVAICLDHFVAVQGRDVDELQRNLYELLLEYVNEDIRENVKPLSTLTAASTHYWEAWIKGIDGIQFKGLPWENDDDIIPARMRVVPRVREGIPYGQR